MRPGACLTILAAAAGCGRIGFDPTSTTGDGALDGTQTIDIDVTTCVQLTVLDDARCAGQLVLTPDAPATSTIGDVWIITPFALSATTSFEVELRVQLSTINPPPADGMTVVFSGDPRGASATADPGAYGGSLGYEVITPSTAIELDDFDNGFPSEPDDNHIGLDRDGDTTSFATAPLPFRMATDSPFSAWVDYAQMRVDAYADTATTKPASSLLSISEDLRRLGDHVWIGLTGATGQNTEKLTILSWRVRYTP